MIAVRIRVQLPLSNAVPLFCVVLAVVARPFGIDHRVRALGYLTLTTTAMVFLLLQVPHEGMIAVMASASDG